VAEVQIRDELFDRIAACKTLVETVIEEELTVKAIRRWWSSSSIVPSMLCWWT
jgi:hypothetical protein